MNRDPLQIKKEDVLHKCMDFYALREEGMEWLQKLTGSIWTDYNVHDPGVTILEQLCYALADLGYRTEFSIQDLLHSTRPKSNTKPQDTYFDPSEILPTNPVSINDYRKLIIDRVQGVKNAWVIPVTNHLLGVKGLYKVYLQLDDISYSNEIVRQVKEVFCAHRNMGEDLEAIEILEKENITVFAELDISSDVIAEEVLAEILFKLEEHLNPSIRFYSVDELIAEGRQIDQIFDGPSPVHGIIKSEDLKPIKQEVYISKMVEIISAVKGVRRLFSFRVEKDGFPVEGDLVHIAESRFPYLDMDTIDFKWKSQEYPIRFERGNLNYQLDLNTANQILYSLYAKYKKGYHVKLLFNEKDYPSLWTQEEISKYYSIQHGFPVTYGLGSLGLINQLRPSRERYAMIKQLRGYLLFFEQILANHLAQLSKIKEIFSLSSDLNQTYFSQVPRHIPFLEEVVAGNQLGSYETKLTETLRKGDPFLQRRNRVLDHLLARFGEHFSTDFLMRLDHYIQDDDQLKKKDSLIQAKIDLLANYVHTSRNKSKGVDYLSLSALMESQENNWNAVFDQIKSIYPNEKDQIESQRLKIREHYNHLVHIQDLVSLAYKEISTVDFAHEMTRKILNDMDLEEKYIQEIHEVNVKHIQWAKDLIRSEVSGLKKRVSLLLSIEKTGNESLLSFFEKEGDQIRLKDLPIQNRTDTEQMFFLTEVHTQNLNQNDPGFSLYQDNFVFRYTNELRFFQELSSKAVFAHQYIIQTISTDSAEVYGIFFKQLQNEDSYLIKWETTRLAAMESIQFLVKTFRALNRSSEGIHQLEHVLLRPQAQDKHGFRLLNDQDRILLQTVHTGNYEDQKFISQQIDLLAAKRDLYEIRRNNDNTFALYVTEYQKDILYCPELFYTEEGAREKRDEIIDFIESFKNAITSLQSFISFYMDDQQGSQEVHENYSLAMTVVIPDWPGRFQIDDFKKHIKNLYRLNAPVHLDIQFKFLNLNQMFAFESMYYEWMSLRSLTVSPQPQLDQVAYKLLQFVNQI